MKKKLFSSSIFGLVSFFLLASVALAATIYWPTQSQRVTSEYGWRTLDGAQDYHYGIDIGGLTAGVGGDSVKAMHNGVVYKSGWFTGYGNTVFINHNGVNKINNVNVQSVYAHLESISTSNGAYVNGNTVIGKMGKSGTKAVHLHFETRNCPTAACDTVKQVNATNPRTWYNYIPALFTDESAESLEGIEGHGTGDLNPDSPNFYSLDELAEMTPDELKAIGYPNPYENFKTKKK